MVMMLESEGFSKVSHELLSPGSGNLSQTENFTWQVPRRQGATGTKFTSVQRGQGEAQTG